MRKILFLLFLIMDSAILKAGIWHSVNLDKTTVAAMSASYVTAIAAESQTLAALDSMAAHYSRTTVATAGILYSKRNTYHAMRSAGLFEIQEENKYYTRIRNLVQKHIMPMFLSVGQKFIKYPENFLRWGPYLYKTTSNVESLCKQFEFVCTNGKLSFSDVKFLVVNGSLQKLCDLANLNGVDFRTALEKVSDFNFKGTIDKMKYDISNIPAMLAQAGKEVLNGMLGDIASSAGVTNEDIANAEKIKQIGTAFHCSPEEIIMLYNGFKDAYERVNDIGNIKDRVMAIIKTKSVEGLRNLFDISKYNINDYIIETIQENHGEYYKQRWYIAGIKRGHDVLCNYEPYYEDSWTKHQDNGAWSEWQPFISDKYSTKSAAINHPHRLTTSEAAQVRAKSEGFAGWNNSRIEDYNRSNEGHTARISYILRNHYRSYRSGGHGSYYRTDFFAYHIDVVDDWETKTVVYEETFDSKTMDLADFKERMNMRLRYYQGGTEGVEYKLYSDEPKYYSEADSEKMKGVASVDYYVDCSNGQPIGSGSFSWKENAFIGTSLSKKCMELAMGYNEKLNGNEIKKIEDEIKQRKQAIEQLYKEISQLDKTRNEVLNQINQFKLAHNDAKVAELKKKYASLTKELEQKESQLRKLESELQPYLNAQRAYYEDLDDELDGRYRIADNMAEATSRFLIRWNDNGNWTTSANQYVFTRTGYSDRVRCKVTYVAKLSMKAPEKWFIVRYHRAILSVDFEVKTESPSSNFIENMQLNINDSPEKRAEKANKRLEELQKDYPDCIVKMRYNHTDESIPTDSLNDKGIHFLWSCDRIDLARKIEGELTSIYAGLVGINHYLDSRETIKEFFVNKILDIVPREKRGKLAEQALQRWKACNRKAMENIHKPSGKGKPAENKEAP